MRVRGGGGGGCLMLAAFSVISLMERRRGERRLGCGKKGVIRGKK